MSQVLKIKQAADYLGAHVETVRRLARKGEIPAFKVGKDWRFRESDLKSWEQTQKLNSRKGRVLVVDDDDDLRVSIRRILEHEGYSVWTAGEGAAALELIRSQGMDVVLLDLKMPGMDGPATLKAIKGLDPGMPVIVVTGYPDGDLMMEAMRHSPFLAMAKPFDVKQTLEAIDLALNGSKSKRAEAGWSMK